LCHHDLTKISQVGHWTLDNAANNGTFIEELGKLLCAKGIVFDHIDRRVMCFPHVINICCEHIIASFTDTELTDDSAVFEVLSPLRPPNCDSLEYAIQRDPIALGRNIVHAFRSSGQRQEAFDNVIRDGNDRGWFESEVPYLQLLRDIKTRWDSIYFTTERLRMIRPVRNYHYARAMLM
jgi:hypothetical protein